MNELRCAKHDLELLQGKRPSSGESLYLAGPLGACATPHTRRIAAFTRMSTGGFSGSAG